jgi:hypothetical protein
VTAAVAKAIADPRLIETCANSDGSTGATSRPVSPRRKPSWNRSIAAYATNASMSMYS